MSLHDFMARCLAKRVSMQEAAFLSSGSAAIVSVLDFLGVGRGDEIVVPDVGCLSVPAAVARTGATIVFVGVGDTLTLSPKDVISALSSVTRAVIGVHLYGLPCDIEGIQAVTPAGVTTIEDFAQAWGLVSRGGPAGSQGHISVTSFGTTKPLSVGTGGAAFFSDRVLHDMTVPDFQSVCNFPYQLLYKIPTAIHEADRALRARREAVGRLLDLLDGTGVQLPFVDSQSYPSWTRLPMYVDDLPKALHLLNTTRLSQLVQTMHNGPPSSNPVFDHSPKRLVRGSTRAREPLLVKPDSRPVYS